MPELPEVEIFKRYLEKTSLNQVIDSVKVLDNRVLNMKISDLKKAVIHNKFKSTTRHGKYLLVNLGQKYLVMHFGMTGDLEYFHRKDNEPKYSKVIFYFESDFNLAYISIRMFGNLDISDSIEDFIKRAKLGPDAYNMSFEQFKIALKRRSAIIKSALLNQSFIAGIGNIYSDEILFRSKLHPKTKIDTLEERKVKELFNKIKEVLRFGIEKQGDLSSYPNDFLIPHREQGEHCPICKSEVIRIEIAGRNGYYCPNCQR